MTTRGIDYGNGQTNIDTNTGIRFGVIPMHEITQAWCDESEGDYGEETCPKCGGSVIDYTDLDDDEGYSNGRPNGRSRCTDFACENCCLLWDSDQVVGEEPVGFTLNDGEYQAHQNCDSDVWITKSIYYTRAQFCSPCAPGACYLLNPTEQGEKAYCFGHEFHDSGKAPYPVYRVDNDEPVEAS